MRGWVLRIGIVLVASTPAACSLLVDTGGFTSGGAPADAAEVDVDAAVVDASTDVTVEAGVDSGLAKYPRTILEDQPILYWRFEETSGPNIRDETSKWPGIADAFVGYGAPGAFQGSLALSFDGSKGSISAGSAGDFIGTQQFSIECWVKPNEADDTFRHPFNKDLDGNGVPRQQYGAFVYLGRLAVERYVDGQGVQSSTESLPINTWYHLVGTYDGQELVLYVNGERAKGMPDTRAAKPKPVPLYIGAHSPGAGVLSGLLDEVAVYDKALSAARVKAHFDAAKP